MKTNALRRTAPWMLLVSCAVMPLALLHQPAEAQSPSGYQTLAYPSAIYTSANGIYGSTVVGTYQDSSNVYHGFTYDTASQVYTPYSASNASATYFFGVSGSSIVGSYVDSSTGDSVGFWYNGTSGTSLSAPSGTATTAYGISGTSIVGAFTGTSGASSGFQYSTPNQQWATLTAPSATDTWAYGISGSSIVGGFLTGGGALEGFLYDGSTWTPLQYPSANSTVARGIGGTTIAGSFNAGSGWQGFLLSGTAWTALNVPGAANGSYAMGTDGAYVVGSYYDSNLVGYGFIATVPEPSATAVAAVGPGLAGFMLWRKRRRARTTAA